jgi:small subunit ribosomal protein S1
MRIILGEKAGCCFGVQRALDIAEKTRQEKRGPVATLGPLIHNPRMVAELDKKGITTVQSLDHISAGTLIVRSHGAGPDLFKQANARNIEVIDATCPFVRLEQELAVALKTEGYTVVIVGERDHAEVRGVAEWLEEQAFVVSPDEVSALPWSQLGNKIGIVSQTTQSLDGLARVVTAVIPHCREIKVHNTICLATVQRQQEVKELAARAELLLVVGGKDSANTRRLAEIGKEQGVQTYHIEAANELDPDWFENVETVAVTAGASTPRSQIQEVVDWLTQRYSGGMTGMENETPNADLVSTEEQNQAEDFEALLQSVPRRLEEGMILKARVVLVRDDAAFVDLGWKSDLPIPVGELTPEEGVSAKEIVKPGDEIRVMVVRSKDPDEPFMLSKRRADQETAWSDLAEKMKGQEVVSARVTRVNKGGLELDLFGVRAFMPASQVGLNYVEDLSAFVGQEFQARIIEFDPDKKRIVLSRRSILEEERKKAEEAIYASIQEGAKLKGKVVRLAPFGAFVDIGGVEGLVHVSELSWERVGQPQEVVSVGDEVEVLVLKVDKEAKRISLSLKQLRPHPWDRVQSRFHEGEIVEGTVVRLAAFGAFVKLAEGVDGLVHISQLAHERVKDPKDVVSVGQNVRVKILSIDTANRKISLSIKETTPAPQVASDAVSSNGESDDDVQAYLKNQESGRLQSNLGALFEKKD